MSNLTTSTSVDTFMESADQDAMRVAVGGIPVIASTVNIIIGDNAGNGSDSGVSVASVAIGADSSTTGNFPVFADTTGKALLDSGVGPSSFCPTPLAPAGSIMKSNGTMAPTDAIPGTDYLAPTSISGTFANPTSITVVNGVITAIS